MFFSEKLFRMSEIPQGRLWYGINDLTLKIIMVFSTIYYTVNPYHNWLVFLYALQKKKTQANSLLSRSTIFINHEQQQQQQQQK